MRCLICFLVVQPLLLSLTSRWLALLAPSSLYPMVITAVSKAGSTVVVHVLWFFPRALIYGLINQ